jgi:hypothetical protein
MNFFENINSLLHNRDLLNALRINIPAPPNTPAAVSAGATTVKQQPLLHQKV